MISSDAARGAAGTQDEKEDKNQQRTAEDDDADRSGRRSGRRKEAESCGDTVKCDYGCGGRPGVRDDGRMVTGISEQRLTGGFPKS